MNYNDIPGWFDFQDIYDLAIEKFPNGKFAEIGCWLGKSTAYMGQQLKKANANIEFYAIDVWDTRATDQSLQQLLKENGGDVYNIFIKNMIDCEVQNFIKPFKMTSLEACKSIGDKSMDFVFIDGSHTYEDVSADLKNWLPKVKTGGILAGHDFWHPPIKQALGEILPTHYQFLGGTSGNTWRFDKIA